MNGVSLSCLKMDSASAQSATTPVQRGYLPFPVQINVVVLSLFVAVFSLFVVVFILFVVVFCLFAVVFFLIVVVFFFLRLCFCFAVVIGT